MNRRLVAGNWKMNLDHQEAKDLLKELKENYDESNTQLVVCPSHIHLSTAVETLKGSSIKVGAQDCSFNQSGAFTGEVSPTMLKSYGVEYVIIGHSERREYHAEDNEIVNKKLLNALDSGLKVILCVGEVLEERKSDQYISVIKSQLAEGLKGVSVEQMENVVIAYEPVWAIGTGETASSDQAQEVHAVIRNFIKEEYGVEASDNTSVLYGGSCKPANAEELFSNKDVDGGLIGGAALKSEDFLKIADSYE